MNKDILFLLIDISVENGNIMSWNSDSQVIRLDNNYSVSKNTTLYFDVNENTTIDITLKRDDLVINTKQIYFLFIDDYYYAKLK